MIQDQNRKVSFGQHDTVISVTKRDFLLKYLLILIFASKQLLFDSSNQDVWNCLPGPGPGGAIHVHEHSWDLHQLPVRPRPAPGLPGDTEVCGGQATPGDREPKTGTKCKTVSQVLQRQSLVTGCYLHLKHMLLYKCSLQVCAMGIQSLQCSY